MELSPWALETFINPNQDMFCFREIPCHSVAMLLLGLHPVENGTHQRIDIRCSVGKPGAFNPFNV